MPEAPEIRAHAERLDKAFGGRDLTGVQMLSFTAAKTFDPPIDAPVGSRLTAVGSRGKHLILQFQDLSGVVHLMQGGRLRPDEKRTRRPRGGLVRWLFDDEALLLSEAGTEHRAGVWTVGGDPQTQPPLDLLGPEADTLDAAQLAPLLGAKGRRLHGFLRDQRALAGLGRRLANEVCHRARLSPFASTTKLDPEQIKALVVAIATCVDESMDFERGLEEMSSSADRPGGVHHRAGGECPECGDAVRQVAYNRYTVNYCAACQTDGKILADNTTSKFLK